MSLKIGGAILILLLSAITTYVILDNMYKSIDLEETYYGNQIGNHNIYYKKDWGGRPAKAVVPLAHPTQFVIISHSGSPPCDSFQTCSRRVKSFQEYHFSRGNNDIGYNFLIGGDANVYVGRGWDIRNFHNNRSIGISFIGDFNYDKLNFSMIAVAKLVLEQGLELKKLSDEYILIGHNQSSTDVPISPGEDVYREIRDWPHFSNKTYFD